MKRKLESICPDDDNLQSGGGTPPMMTTTRASTIIPHGLPTPFTSNFHIASVLQQPFANNLHLSADHSMMLQSATATMNQQQHQPPQPLQFTLLPQLLPPSSPAVNHSLPPTAALTSSHGYFMTTATVPPQQNNDWLIAPPLQSQLQYQQQQQQQLNHLPQYHHHQVPQLYASTPPFQQAMIPPNMQIPSFTFPFQLYAQTPFIQPEKVYEAMDTRFNEIPSEVLSIIIDFIPLGSQTILKFILTNGMVYNIFKNHGYFTYHQFRSSIPSILQYLCSDNSSSAEKELCKMIRLMKTPLEKIRAQARWPVKKESWEKWVANDRSVPCPVGTSVSLKHRQSIYDKFYSLVTFEMVKEKHDEYGAYRSTRHARIRIGTKILLTFESHNSESGNNVQLTIDYGRDRSLRHIEIENSRRRPYSSEFSDILNEFKEVLGLKDVSALSDDMVDLILFALPFAWDRIGYC